MNVLDLYIQRGLTPQKAGSEHHGPCPDCRGDDRFVIFPDQNGGEGSYWCRQCGKAGDNIQFLMDFEGKTYQEAAQAVGRELADLPPRRMTDRKRKKEKVEFDPTENLPPGERWQARADKFVDACCRSLLKDVEKLAWLKNKRGITEETVRRHRIGWHEGEKDHNTWRPRESWGLPEKLKENGRKKMLWLPAGLVIPRMDRDVVTSLRIRRPSNLLKEHDKTRYYVVEGSSSRQLLLGMSRRAYVVVEAELDGYLLFQELDKIGVGVLALGSSATKPDANAWPHIQRSVCVLNTLDYDNAGAGASEWWRRHVRTVRRWPVPIGKDPGEAFEAGIDFIAWAIAGLAPLWRIGCSLRSAHQAGGGVVEKIEAEKTKQTNLSEYPDGVRRLCEIMACMKVGIEKTDTVTRSVKNAAWEKANPDLAREFSNLVMMDADCREYINRHPENRITGDNFWKKGS